MKNTNRYMALVAAAMLSVAAVSAQNPSGQANNVFGANGIGWNPGPRIKLGNLGGNGNGNLNPGPQQNIQAAPPMGAPNGIGWNPGPNNPGMGPNPGFGPGLNPTPVAPILENVLAVGYDDSGNLIHEPLLISIGANDAGGSVTVLNAWNPWTDSWNTDVDMPAFSTLYTLGDNTYNYYAPLATGTYYFNL